MSVERKQSKKGEGFCFQKGCQPLSIINHKHFTDVYYTFTYGAYKVWEYYYNFFQWIQIAVATLLTWPIYAAGEVVCLFFFSPFPEISKVEYESQNQINIGILFYGKI